jgi:hypothetical protein
MIPSQRADLVARHVDGEALILDRAAERVHQLNATAAYIWDRCNGASSIEDVAARFAGDFGIETGVARADVLKTVADLQKLGLLVGGPQGSDGETLGQVVRAEKEGV